MLAGTLRSTELRVMERHIQISDESQLQLQVRFE